MISITFRFYLRNETTFEGTRRTRVGNSDKTGPNDVARRLGKVFLFSLIKLFLYTNIRYTIYIY
jgi:hypothetical protein